MSHKPGKKFGKGKNMDIRPYMAKFGFGRAYSRLIIIEQDGKLWLAFASEGAGTFMMSSDSLSAGLLEINLMHNGESAPYTYDVSESMLRISSEHGKVSVVVDVEAGALRFEGEGAALRFDSKNTEQSTSNLNRKNGTVVSMGGGRFFFTARRGTISFDDTWILNRFRSVPPLLDAAPDGGKIELIVYDLPTDTDAPEITKPIDQCAEENAADFKSFSGKLVATPAEWDDVREKIAYLMWINQRKINGKDVILANKLRSADLSPVKLSVASMALTDATYAADMITAAESVSPAAQATAILRLFEEGLFKKVSRKTVFDLFRAMYDHEAWWTKERTDGSLSLYYYAYRYEAGAPANALFASGSPVFSPDICTYMILASKALAKLGEFTGNSAEAAKWNMRAGEQLDALLKNLWDGDKFVGKNTFTGELAEADESIANTPLMLGADLPKDISEKLAARVNGGADAVLNISGLYRAGYEKQAANIVTAELEKAREAGIDDTYYGAALLALAHIVL